MRYGRPYTDELEDVDQPWMWAQPGQTYPTPSGLPPGTVLPGYIDNPYGNPGEDDFMYFTQPLVSSAPKSINVPLVVGGMAALAFTIYLATRK